MFEQALEFIQTNLAIAPYLIFGLLLMAGFNLPVSEDVLLFTSAFIAIKNPDMLWPLFFGVYLGAYFSDLISYCLGRYLGPYLWKIKFFANMVPKEKINTVQNYFERYGILTLIVGRFIPFGVRNPMFITAGLSKMNAAKFAFGDFVASTLTCSIYFSLYYNFGEQMIEILKKFNILIFSLFLIGVVIFFIKRKKKAAAI